MKFSFALALSGFSGILAFTTAVPAATAAFIGPYSVSNWTLTNVSANGSIDTSTAPAAITLTGGDNQTGSVGTTDFSIPIVSAGTLSFDWNYATTDEVSNFDPAFFVLNGVDFPLSDSNVISQSGVVSIPVQANDLFAFRVKTEENLGGSAALAIANFDAAPIPTPALLPGLVMMGVASAHTALKRRST